MCSLLAIPGRVAEAIIYLTERDGAVTTRLPGARLGDGPLSQIFDGKGDISVIRKKLDNAFPSQPYTILTRAGLLEASYFAVSFYQWKDKSYSP